MVMMLMRREKSGEFLLLCRVWNDATRHHARRTPPPLSLGSTVHT